jgi:hypothetical protein
MESMAKSPGVESAMILWKVLETAQKLALLALCLQA